MRAIIVDMTELLNISENVKAIRAALGLTQAEVCERASDAGAGRLHVSDVSNAERGVACSMGVLSKLAAGLGVGADKLLRPTANHAQRSPARTPGTYVQSKAGGC